MAKVVARGYFDVVGLDQGGVECQEASLTVQSSKDECDINNIVNKLLRSGEPLPELRGVYADLSGMPDLQSALDQVVAADEAFMALPARVRTFFDNDPVKLVAFAQDPANLPKAIELGLAEPKASLPPSQPAPGPVGAGSAPPATP